MAQGVRKVVRPVLESNISINTEDKFVMLTSVLQAIGHTPMLRLKMSADLPGTVWIKLENRNPGGSIKDRPAFRCLAGAMARKEIRQGACLVTATSGNFGIGLALVSRALGLYCIIVMPESMSKERRALLKGYGAELVLTPAARGMAAAIEEARKISLERGAWLLDQFANPDCVAAHYESTGPEILYESACQMRVLVAGVGSGGTITGAGRYLKESISDFRVIGVEPEASPVLSGGKAGAHSIQGIGPGFVPKILDTSLLDEIILANGAKALETARSVMSAEGVCCGISSGANVAAALSVAARPEMEGKNIVTFVCDTGERYLSTELFS